MSCWLVLRAALLVLASNTISSISFAESADVGANPLYAKDNLVAWCVVPFDNQNRSPAERVRMLQELGFRSLAWDWRMEHLDSLETEAGLLRDAGIELRAVWCWIDDRFESGLGAANERLLSILKLSGIETEIWMSFAPSFFEGLSDEESVAKGARTISELSEKARAIGCTVALYNHGDWFGEPRNMIKIVERVGSDDVRLVYNFHHAHEQLDEFEANLALMLPYLSAVNLNGTRVEGPKILPLGTGDREEQMMRQLKDSGFTGSIGILGHVEDADVEQVLTKNLQGLEQLLKNLGDMEALATY